MKLMEGHSTSLRHARRQHLSALPFQLVPFVFEGELKKILSVANPKQPAQFCFRVAGHCYLASHSRVLLLLPVQGRAHHENVRGAIFLQLQRKLAGT